jgi:uncharacterized protein YbbC (DUF1343 family)
MRTLVYVIVASIIAFGSAWPQTPVVKTGIEVLRDRNFDILAGKRVGLITNPTGVDAMLRSTIDILFAAPEVKLVALFGPEHGVRGDYSAGDKVESYMDSRTGLPVHSLYGKTRKPTPDMLKDIDVLVYDIQDIGVRSYTYIATMGLAMEAAAEQNIEFVVLDRPNPLGGQKIEGNLVQRGFESFVSPYPIPYVYGLTCGELATMLNEERMLTDRKKCKLTVVPMEGWKREMTFEDTGLQWVPTSPHVPMESSPIYYVSTGILGELGVISEGVGYTIPFRVFAAEWIDEGLLARRMDELKLEGVLFRPIVFKPYYGAYAGRVMRGVQLHITDYSRVNLMSLQFLFMQVHHQLYRQKNPFEIADEARLTMFDRVVGTDEIRRKFMERMRYDDIAPMLNKDVEKFRERSRKYWMY